MRLWSLHPSYLDAKGLVALWREGLLAQKVLAGKTRGYRHHPQLDRFKKHGRPLAAIGGYLLEVAAEARRRGYSFNTSKIRVRRAAFPRPLSVTRGQLGFEESHLRRKLKLRDGARLKAWPRGRTLPHPLFRLRAGAVEAWERGKA